MSDKRIHSTKIVRKHGEYVVQAYDKGGNRMPFSDYYSGGLGKDYREDAENTARAMVRPLRSQLKNQPYNQLYNQVYNQLNNHFSS